MIGTLCCVTLRWFGRHVRTPTRIYCIQVERASHTTSASSVAGRVTLVQSLQKRSSITLQSIIPGSSLRDENVSEKAIAFL